MSAQKRPGEVYTKKNINLILKHISKRCPTGIRNRAIVGILHGSGIRCQEMLDLYPGDLDTTSGKIIIKNGKGGKYRTVGISQSNLSLIDLWLNKRRELNFNGNKRLFCTLQGGPMSSAYIRGYLARLSKKIEAKTGEKLRLHAHGLRHTMASELVAEGFSLLEIQGQLGHSSPVTTSRYLHHIAPGALINKMYARQGVL